MIPLCNSIGGKLLLIPSLSYNKLFVRVTFRILSNINDGAFLWKQPTTLTRWLFLLEISTKRFLTRRRLFCRLKVLSLWGVGGLQVYGICSRRLVHSEVTEARSNYKKSYLCWFRNLAYSDTSGSDRIEKGLIGVSSVLVWGKRGEEGWRDLVSVKRL